MEKEFIPYKQALELKELGFDKITFGVYYISDDKHEVVVSNGPYNYGKNTGIYKKYNVLTPTFSQAFRWFREKYNLIPDIQYYGNWNFEIFRIGEFAEPMDDVNVDYTFRGGTYEESELECLKKLIEIVKSK